MPLSVETVGNRDQFIRLLIYGPPGVGKTTFAAGAPNPVILDYENSSEVLRGTDLENVPLAGTRKELANYEEVLRFIKAPNPYDTIIIDSLTSMNDTMLMELIKNKPDRHIALFQDFRKMTNILKEIFYELITVKKHVVLVAHEKVWRDQETNRVLEVRPKLPPEAEGSIERLINEVFYLEEKPAISGPGSRILHVDSHGKILAKNRQHLAVKTLENPTWKEIYKWS